MSSSSSTSPSTNLRVVPLIPKPQQYAWGKLGVDSEVASVLSSSGHAVNNTQPYAELWMGTHPAAPADIINPHTHNSEPLSVYIQSSLPYLFKILSIRTALSIQAHPDLTLAPILHRENPKEYKDSNHKPEMATAITPFEAMCGFRPHTQISVYLSTVPELRNIIGEEAAAVYQQEVKQDDNSTGSEDRKKAALKRVFTALMTAKEDVFKPQLHTLLDRIHASSVPLTDPNQQQPYDLNVYTLIPRLQSQYPDDIGIWCVFLLNCFAVQPPTSIFLPANEPHAYLAGDIVECMACSDNVVRAGLTPKFRDVKNLTQMLTYHAHPISFMQANTITSTSHADNHTSDSTSNNYTSNSSSSGSSSGSGTSNALEADEGVTVLIPPIVEFVLYTLCLHIDGHRATLPANESHSILLVYKGNGIMYSQATTTEEHRPSWSSSGFPIHAGSVYFIPAGTTLTIQCQQSQPLIVFKCAENDEMKKKQSKL